MIQSNWRVVIKIQLCANSQSLKMLKSDQGESWNLYQNTLVLGTQHCKRECCSVHVVITGLCDERWNLKVVGSSPVQVRRCVSKPKITIEPFKTCMCLLGTSFLLGATTFTFTESTVEKPSVPPTPEIVNGTLVRYLDDVSFHKTYKAKVLRNVKISTPAGTRAFVAADTKLCAICGITYDSTSLLQRPVAASVNAPCQFSYAHPLPI